MTPDDAPTAPTGGGPPPLYFNNWRDNLWHRADLPSCDDRRLD